MKNTKDNIHYDGGSSFLIWGAGKTSGSGERGVSCDSLCLGFPVLQEFSFHECVDAGMS